MQLWPHKLDWWWSHRKRVILHIAQPPVIEMRILTERKLVERLFFSDVSHLIIGNKFPICYTACLRNMKNLLVFFFVNLYVDKEFNMLLMRILWKSKLQRVKTIEHISFICLFNQRPLYFVFMTSSICVRILFLFYKKVFCLSH
jgi:hypothetical protein